VTENPAEVSSAASHPGRPGWTKLAMPVASVLLVAASLLFVVLTLVHDRAAASAALHHARLWWLAPAFVVGAAGIFYNAWRWGAAIQAVGGERGPLARLFASYYVGELAKYVPGGIWSVVGRSEISRREGRSRAVSYASVLLSLIAWYLAAVASALVVAVIALGSGSVNTNWWPVLAVVTVAALLLVHPAVHSRLLSLAERLLRRPIAVELPTWSTCLKLALSYIPTWIGIAVATTIVAHALVPHPPLARVALATIVAWIVGFVSPSPSGIGVREAVFVATAGLAAGPAAAIAVLARVMFVLVDLSGAAVGSWFLRGAPHAAWGLAPVETADLAVTASARPTGSD
jgi:uncharacterized membrane protein YbhN (UPF0104 family)